MAKYKMVLPGRQSKGSSAAAALKQPAGRASPAGKLRSSVRGTGTINFKQPGDSIGAPYDSLLEAATLIGAGLPFSSIRRLQKASGFTLDRIKKVTRMSEGSFARRKLAGRLSPDESERLLRISRIFERATWLHDGDQLAAREWLETPIAALADQRPLDLSQTDVGAREVEDLIGRIEHGVVS